MPSHLAMTRTRHCQGKAANRKAPRLCAQRRTRRFGPLPKVWRVGLRPYRSTPHVLWTGPDDDRRSWRNLAAASEASLQRQGSKLPFRRGAQQKTPEGFGDQRPPVGLRPIKMKRYHLELECWHDSLGSIASIEQHDLHFDKPTIWPPWQVCTHFRHRTVHPAEDSPCPSKLRQDLHPSLRTAAGWRLQRRRVARKPRFCAHCCR